MRILDRFDRSTMWDAARCDGNWNKDPERRVRGIALHKTGFEHDTAAGVISWFHNRQSRVSAHYVVDRDGSIYRVIPEEYVAYASGGTSERPSVWRTPDGQTLKGYDVNRDTIAIEIVGASGAPYSPAQLTSVKELVGDICKRHGLKAQAVFAHRDVQAGKSDGAEHLGEIRAEVNGRSQPLLVNGVAIRVAEFKEFFEKCGGVHTFGFPLGPECEVNGRTVQFFERYVMELAPEIEGEWRVRGWRLGAEAAGGE